MRFSDLMESSEGIYLGEIRGVLHAVNITDGVAKRDKRVFFGGSLPLSGISRVLPSEIAQSFPVLGIVQDALNEYPSVETIHLGTRAKFHGPFDTRIEAEDAISDPMAYELSRAELGLERVVEGLLKQHTRNGTLKTARILKSTLKAPSYETVYRVDVASTSMEKEDIRHDLASLFSHSGQTASARAESALDGGAILVTVNGTVTVGN